MMRPIGISVVAPLVFQILQHHQILAVRCRKDERTDRAASATILRKASPQLSASISALRIFGCCANARQNRPPFRSFVKQLSFTRV